MPFEHIIDLAGRTVFLRRLSDALLRVRSSPIRGFSILGRVYWPELTQSTEKLEPLCESLEGIASSAPLLSVICISKTLFPNEPIFPVTPFTVA